MSTTKKVRLNTYPKVMTTAVIIHGMVLTTASYVLAFLDKEPVADVSTTIVTEIVAPVVVYLATNMILNIFEKNKLTFSTPLDAQLYKQGKPYGEKGKKDELVD